MTKRTVSAAAVLFVLALVMGGVGRADASPYTIGCQGLDVRSVGEGATGPTGSDSALWSVVIKGSSFTGGNLTAMYTNDPGPSGGEPALTCYYTLNTVTSSFATANGMVLQTLNWTFVSQVSNGSTGVCSSDFTDHVYLMGGGASLQMIDDNLEDDDTAGSGTCTAVPSR